MICALFQESVETGTHLDPTLKEVSYNPTYETMFAPEVIFSILKKIIINAIIVLHVS